MNLGKSGILRFWRDIITSIVVCASELLVIKVVNMIGQFTTLPQYHNGELPYVYLIGFPRYILYVWLLGNPLLILMIWWRDRQSFIIVCLWVLTMNIFLYITPSIVMSESFLMAR